MTKDQLTPHPAPFPIELPIRALQATGAICVLDPFVGSGTTALAAIKMGRNYIGIDNSPEYVAMAEERISNHKKQGVMV